MNKESKGGRRPGAGRKPSGIKKSAVTLYVADNKIAETGGLQFLRKHLYAYLDQPPYTETQNKPNTAPQIEKPTKDKQKEGNGQERPGNGAPEEFIEKHLNKIKELQTQYAERYALLAPKTLDELKALCPPELKGLDRSEWISKHRKLYGI